jgi:DNA-directed RNA polymerase I, II, and III subunit RPABC2
MADDGPMAGPDEEMIEEEFVGGTEADEEAIGEPKRDLARQLVKLHPEVRVDTVESVAMKTMLKSIPPNFKNADGQLDGTHRSPPFLLQYERTRILGFRTNQLSQGARPYIAVPPHITDLRDIAKMELEARRLPFIVKRPMPDGSFEMWRLSDLLIL